MSLLLHAYLFVAFLLLLFSIAPEPTGAQVQKTCYAPDGITTPLDWEFYQFDYKPCIDVAGVDSMCCALNRTDSTVDTCQRNGLCVTRGLYFRDWCTDPTWKSPNCLPKTCANDAMNGTTQMTLCTDGTFCCGPDSNTDCCAKSLGFKLPDLAIFQSTSSSSLSKPSNTTIPPSSPNSDTTKVGVGVGVGLGILAIVGSILAFWLGQRRGVILGEKKMSGTEYAMSSGGVVRAENLRRSELEQGGCKHDAVVPELAAKTRPAELGSGRM